MPGSGTVGARRRREILRRSYRPHPVRLLFIGEAPPASGRFFYQCDSGLYRAIRDAFLMIDPSLAEADFLRVFQAVGCYLIDLCPNPVDKMDPAARRAACVAAEGLLARTIRELQPQTILTVVRSIRGNVERAASRAGRQDGFIELPYPGRWARHREVFLEALVQELQTLPYERGSTVFSR